MLLNILVLVNMFSMVIIWWKLFVCFMFVGLKEMVSSFIISSLVLIFISVLIVVYREVLVSDILGEII